MIRCKIDRENKNRSLPKIYQSLRPCLPPIIYAKRKIFSISEAGLIEVASVFWPQECMFGEGDMISTWQGTVKSSLVLLGQAPGSKCVIS